MEKGFSLGSMKESIKLYIYKLRDTVEGKL